MKILKVTLENVKSYQQEEICFNDGINVIAGRNGAGKSTLIESVGFALFGYLNKDYNFQDFLSHGANNGSIMVDFEVDGCRYRIERHFTSRGTRGWVIFDYQTDEAIETHTAEDVNFTLARIMGVEQNITLAELFERIIGVNQGTFTEPFLRSPSGRKEYFERIFMLDSYKTAYQKSSESASILRNQLDDLEKELIKLRTRVETYQETQRLFREAEQKLLLVKETLEEKQSQFVGIKTEIQGLKDLKELIQVRENEQLKLKEQEKQLTERQITLAEEIEVSRKSRELVEQYQGVHQVYLQYKEKIDELEKQLEIQEQLTIEKRDLETQVAVMEKELTTREENIVKNREILLQEYDRRQEELEEYSYPLEGIKRELQLVAEEELKAAKIGGSLQEITQAYQESKELIRQLEDRLDEIRIITGEIAEFEDRLSGLAELQQEVTKISSVERLLAEVNHSISAVETRIENEEDNMAKVGDGLCPLLKTVCQTIEGQNLKDYFALRIKKLNDERARSLKTKAKLADELLQLREKVEQLAVLLSLEEELVRQRNKLADVRARGLELAQKIYTIIRGIYEILHEVKKGGYLAEVHELSFDEFLPLELFEQSSVLKVQLDIVANWLTISQNEVQAKEKKTSSKKEELNRRKTEFTSKIQQLKERSKEINQQLDRLTDLEKMLVKDKRKLTEDLAKITEYTDILANYGDIKGELKLSKEKMVELEAGNNIYLTNQQKALEWDNLLQMRERFAEQLHTITIQLAKIEAELLIKRESYDQQKLVDFEEQAEKMNRQISQAETLLTEGERRSQELADKLREMDKIKEQIKDREAEESSLKKAFELLNFIRNVYNTSAQEIAYVFLHFISYEATKIYRQLSGENVQLVWEKDYQVNLQDKQRTRVFRQLSGGEQMSAAFAIRLALLRKFSAVRLGFFDEPTTHLDEYRRLNIAQAIASIREKEDNYFEQIFIISHDDTFTTLTENLIKLDKDSEQGSYLVKD